MQNNEIDISNILDLVKEKGASNLQDIFVPISVDICNLTQVYEYEKNFDGILSKVIKFSTKRPFKSMLRVYDSQNALHSYGVKVPRIYNLRVYEDSVDLDEFLKSKLLTSKSSKLRVDKVMDIEEAIPSINIKANRIQSSYQLMQRINELASKEKFETNNSVYIGTNSVNALEKAFFDLMSINYYNLACDFYGNNIRLGSDGIYFIDLSEAGGSLILTDKQECEMQLGDLVNHLIYLVYPKYDKFKFLKQDINIYDVQSKIKYIECAHTYLSNIYEALINFNNKITRMIDNFNATSNKSVKRNQILRKKNYLLRVSKSAKENIQKLEKLLDVKDYDNEM